MKKINYVLSFKTPQASSFSFMHDPSATLSKNGKIIAGAEEERFIREKHAINKFPYESIKYCLAKENIDFKDLNKIVIPDDPNHFRFKSVNISNFRRLKYKILLNKNYKEKPFEKNYWLNYNFTRKECKKLILAELHKHFGEKNYPDIEFLSHHLCHAASCYYPSGFEDASIITIDGVGDCDSTVLWSGTKHNIKKIRTWGIDNSLGHYYGVFTVYLGYEFCSGESKIMGLAPYGERNKDIFNVMEEIIKTDEESYDVTEISIPLLFGYNAAIKRMEDVFGIKRRLPGEEFKKEHKDLAYAAQFFLEEICVNLVKQVINKSGNPNVCLTGGVGLNCKMNKKIMEMQEVNDVFIQPIANDAGCTIGAVLEESKRQGFDVFFKMNHNYFGPEYDDKIVEKELNNRKLNFSKISDLKPIAQKIADGKFVGWFQGKMEMGPRALGNRSILADPRSYMITDKLNDYVKHREKWRPFGPSILEEYADVYITNYSFAPFMIKTFNVKEKFEKDIEGVIHPSDKTTRPHVVYKEVNNRYYNLIEEFRKITGIPLILNTSFNDHGEPIVCSPKDAIDTFLKTGLNDLVLNDFLVEKDKN